MIKTLTGLQNLFKTVTSKKPSGDFFAWLGNAQGKVVADTNNGVYIMDWNGNVRVVLNNKVPPYPFRPVRVGYVSESSKVLEVKEFIDAYPTQRPPNVPGHASNHEWGGIDTMFVHGEQILPGVAIPGDDDPLVLHVAGFVYFLNGWHIIDSFTLDVTSYIPASGAKFLLLEADDAGAITVQSGSSVDLREALVMEDIPLPTLGKVPLVAVMVYTGQVQIWKTLSKQDIVDLRWSRYATGVDTSITAPLYAGRHVAAADPTVTDDDTAGFLPLYLWLNSTSGDRFICTDNSTGAAVWEPLTGGGGGAVETVTGDGVDNTDPANPVISYPTPGDIGADLAGAADTAEINAKAYADGLVVGLWDDRGSYDASGGAYPSTGGSGTAGAILKGDVWTISVAGTLPTGQAVEVGDIVRALVNAPGNTQANWAITQNNIGYVAENSANKATSMTGNETSNILYLTAKAIYDWAVGLFVALSGNQTISGVKTFSSDPIIPDEAYDATAWNGSLEPPTKNAVRNKIESMGSGGREVLTADRTYYVRTDGNNSNDGLANTSGGAFLTVQKAVDVAYSIDLSTFNVTIQVADGTYTTPIVLSKPFVGKGNVTIQGNSGTPANVLISTTSANAVSVSNAAAVVLKNFKIQTTTSGTGIYAEGGAIVDFYNLNFGACSENHILSTASALVYARSSYAISGGALRHWFCTGVATIIVTGITITITGTPAFSVAFAVGSLVGCVSVYTNTYSGSATGKRYSATLNGVIFTNGATLPGNVAGTTATGGQYN